MSLNLLSKTLWLKIVVGVAQVFQFSISTLLLGWIMMLPLVAFLGKKVTGPSAFEEYLMLLPVAALVVFFFKKKWSK